MNWNHVSGIASLAGVGFKMSIFITALAFEDHTLVDRSKYVILLASLFLGTLDVHLLKIA